MTRQPPFGDYTDACEAAATAQGLDPAVNALRMADVKVEVEQTGGMTMVATVYNTDDTEAVGITWDGQFGPCRHGSWDGVDCAESYGDERCRAQPRLYLVVHYPHRDREGIVWEEGETVTDQAEAEQLPQLVTAVLA